MILNDQNIYYPFFSSCSSSLSGSTSSPPRSSQHPTLSHDQTLSESRPPPALPSPAYSDSAADTSSQNDYPYASDLLENSSGYNQRVRPGTKARLFRKRSSPGT